MFDPDMDNTLFAGPPEEPEAPEIDDYWYDAMCDEMAASNDGEEVGDE